MRRAFQAAKPYAVIVLTAACCTATLYLLTGALKTMALSFVAAKGTLVRRAR